MQPLPSPGAFHEDRLRLFQQQVERQDTRDAAVAYARMAVFVVWCVTAWNAARNGWEPGWAWGSGAVFAVLVVVHRRIAAALALARRGARHHTDALGRLKERFEDAARRGASFGEDAHPYARDLDLFGEGGVFERMNQARTRPGEQWLAHMLMTPTDAATARARQDAVREWEAAPAFRESVALCGSDGVAAVDMGVLHRWVARPDGWPQGAAVWHLAALVPGAAGVTALGLWAFSDAPLWWAGVAAAVNMLILRALQPRLEPTLGALHRPGAHLRALSGVMETLQGHPLEAPRNRACRDALKDADGRNASDSVRDLARRVELLEWRFNQFFLPFGILMLWDIHCTLRVEAWRKRNGPRVRAWVEATAELEALCSLGTYAFENPAHTYPTLREGPPHVDADALAHPLLPSARAVGNDVRLVSPVRLLLVSGSNMSGKSTLLRAVGLNTVLAMAGTRVRASRMEVAPVALGCTMRVEDSLQAGRSRFMAELLRLRQVAELAQRGPMLFLLDEILHGTNSHDRLAGGEAFLRSLLGHGAAGLCTTHDLALARATEGLGEAAVNVHFRDDVKDGVMAFDHVMRAGVVDRSNALELMRMLGLEV